MNLHRHSENMSETGVANARPKTDNANVVVLESERLTLSGKAKGSKTRMPQEVAAAILRSGSEDSGVGLDCSETENAPATPPSPAKEMDCRPLREKDGRRSSTLPSFHNPSSRLPLSSSLYTTTPGRLEPSSMCFRVEQVLWRADQTSKRVLRKSTSQLSVAASLFRTDSGHDMGPRFPCHSMTSTLGQRSGSLGTGEAVHPPTSIQHVTELLRHCHLLKDLQPKSVHPCLSGNEQSDDQPQCEEERVCDARPGKGLSPGLGYLEQVCAMLEEIARLQTSNQELRKENERVQNHQNEQGCQELFGQCISSCPEDPVPVNQKPEAKGSNDLSGQSTHNDQVLSPCLLERSMSDTQAQISSKRKTVRESQWIPRTGHVLEECDSSTHHEKPQDRMSNLVLKLKTVSLNRDEALQKPVRQQTFPSGKIGPKKPLRLLFKKRGKTLSAC